MGIRSQPRVRAGIPAGGQWAPSRHDSEDDVDLNGELVRMVQAAARREASRYSLDKDDLAGEVLLKVTRTGTDGVRNLNAYVSVATHRLALSTLYAKRTGRSFYGSEWRAYREYREQCSSLEQELHRYLTDEEKDRIADGIRARSEGWLSKGFHRHETVITVPLSEEGSDDGPSLTVQTEDDFDYSSRRTFAPGSLADRTLRLAMGYSGPKHNLARFRMAELDVWDALASEAGAPLAMRAEIDRRQASLARKTIAGAGGALAAASSYLKGEIDEEVEEALFLPFGQLSRHDKSAVVALLKKHSNYADEIWGSAVGAATGRNSQQRRPA